MTFTSLPQGSAQTSEDDQSLVAVLPARRWGPLQAFLIVWLLCWSAGEAFVLYLLLENPRAGTFTLVVAGILLVFTLGGGHALFRLLWMNYGREILRLERSGLTLRRELFGVGRTRTYPRERLLELRVDPWSSDLMFLPYAPGERREPTDGALAFGHGRQAVRFGGGLTDSDATTLRWRLLARLERESAG